MKNILVSLCSFISILFVLIYINPLTDKIVTLINSPNTSNLTLHNDYYKDANYSFVSNTSNFIPYGKSDLLNIVYTIINSGMKSFTFYCPKEYQNCISDMNMISKDSDLLTHLTNFVHPFNSFTSIKTTLSDSGEITIKVNYLYTAEEIKVISEKVDQLLTELITPEVLKSDNINYDKIKIIHDYIINNTKYDVKNDEKTKSFNAYGALFNHLATCNGYTDLMAIFLSKLGYNNYKIATPSSNEKSTEGHVWNAVEINNEWLHLDLTWDDPVSSDGKDYLYHKYFLINTNELITADSNITSKEHLFDYKIYPELKNTP